MSEEVKYIYQFIFFKICFKIPGLPISTQAVSISSSLRSPRFDDEIDDVKVKVPSIRRN